MTREEATIVARHIAAGACAMHGCAPDYCRIMREGRLDDDTVVQSTLAALMLSPTHLAARLKAIREEASNVVEIAA